MPTITCSIADLQKLSGVKSDKISQYLEMAKAEEEKLDGDNLTVKYNDTNQPYLWSVEGLARFMRAAHGRGTGIPKLTLQKSELTVNVDPSVAKVRPYIACFVAQGPPLTEYQVKQLIQLQEKLAENYGRRRSKVGAGLFPAGTNAFPLTYKAVKPETTTFIPLGMSETLNLRQILETHPKGKEYSWLLKNAKKYPIVLNAANEILTFPPIINSETTGKLTTGTKEILCEVTGTDLKSVQLVSTIFAYVFSERGFTITPAKIQYGRKTIITPNIEGEVFNFDPKQVKTILGLTLNENEIRELLERAQYDAIARGKVRIPPYRADIMHSVDVIEDIGIMYGLNKLEPQNMTTYTIGGTFQIQKFIDNTRKILAGLGYQELLSAYLTNKQELYRKMNTPDPGTVEIEEYISETYSVVRSWILPQIMQVLSKNKHVEYPQKIFEEGHIATVNETIIETNHIALATSHANADYTEIKQTTDTLLRLLNIEYTVEPYDHPTFIPGRAAKIIAQGKTIGMIGEIHPQVLNNWELTMPVAAAELDIKEMFNSKLS